MTKSANDLDPGSVERAIVYDWCTVQRAGVHLFGGLPRQIVHDTGKRIWIFVNTGDEPLPPETSIVEDDGDSYHDVNGNYLVSIPVEWCTIIDEEQAERIQGLVDVYEELKGYMH